MNKNNFSSPVEAPPDKEPILRVKRATKNLARQIEEQIEQQPMVALGAVAGLGFIAGSLLGSRLGQLALAVAGGYALHDMLQKEGGVEKLMKEGIDKLTGEHN
jgi:hypothetical protein